MEHDLYVVLCPPKTGSQTIEAALQALVPKAAVRRAHSVSREGLRRMRKLADQLGSPEPVIAQADMGERLNAEIETVRAKGGRIAILTAYREPIERAISSMWQNFPEAMPHYQVFMPFETEEWLRMFALGHHAIWRDELAGTDRFDKERALWSRCLYDADYFNIEVEAISGIDLSAHPFDTAAGFVIAKDGLVSVAALRAADLDRALPAALSQLTGRRRSSRFNSLNVGEDKSYADYYRSYRDMFRAPADMIDAIYERDRWLRYFHSADEVEGFKRHWTRD